jgi:serine protease
MMRRVHRARGACRRLVALALLATAVCAPLLIRPAAARPRTATGARRAIAVHWPNDPLFRYQWNLQAMGIPQAWSVSRGAGVVVAVLDTGVAYENRGVYRRAPDLAGTRFAPGWDFVGKSAHPDDIPPPDRRSHGTQMASIIAETADNGIGAAGVAPAATIMPLRVLNPDESGMAATIARGLRFAADHGAKVANLSIAGPAGSQVLKAAVDYAYSKGVTIVAAAGNDGSDAVSYPAAYPHVISVGAVAEDLTRAWYSNYGPRLDLVAPAGAGEDVDSGYGPTDGVVAETLKGGPTDFCYCFTASTSAAAAEVSGVAALVIGSGRATTPSQVRAALLAGARHQGRGEWNPQLGAGMVSATGSLAAAEPPTAQRSYAARPAAADPPALAWVVSAIAGLTLLALLGRGWVNNRGRRAGAASVSD